MNENERSNGSHSPFRPTRFSPAGYRPYAEQEDRDPALALEQEADAEAEAYVARNYGDSGVRL